MNLKLTRMQEYELIMLYTEMSPNQQSAFAKLIGSTQ